VLHREPLSYKKKKAGGVAQAVEHLLRKGKALSSNSSTTKKQKKYNPIPPKINK
jgi:hypothetical protein